MIALSSCASDPGASRYGTKIDQPQVSETTIDTLYGNYLAARHATRERDTSSAAAYYKTALASDPGNQIIRERALLLEVTSGNFEAAERHASQLVEDRPTNRIARMVLASEEIKKNNYPGARAQMGESAMGLYNALAVDIVRAWSYAGESDLAGAERTLTGLNAFGSGELIRSYHLGLIYQHAGNSEKAEEHFLNALETGGRSSLRIVEAYGNFLHRQGRTREAVTLYEEFLTLVPDQSELLIAKDLAENGKSVQPLVGSVQDGAAEAFLSVAGFLNTERTSDLAVIYLRLALNLRDDLQIAKAILGDLYQRNRQWESAVQMYATIPVEHALGTEAAIQIAANLQRLDRNEESLMVLGQLLAEKPNDFAARVSLADHYRTLERYEEAVAEYTKSFEILAVEKREPSWFLYYARGISYHFLDRWPEAEQDLLHALEIAPEQPLVLNYLGYSWVERNYRVHDALALVEKAAELSPRNGFIIDSLGWAYYHVENYDRAVRHLERAVELEPEDPTLHDHLGDAYWKKGRYLEAGFEWQHALKLEPDAEVVLSIERKLANREQLLKTS
jgi:tetratricopeptide (TPR) repeat protein